MANLKQINADLRLENKQQAYEIKMLKSTISDLEKRLALALSSSKVVKTSRNSHNPPSQDKFKPKRNTSLRLPSSKSSGGQPNHKGQTLKMVSNPDQVEVLKSNFCRKCGSNLSASHHYKASERQVIDLPVVRPITTAYHQYACQCSCGHVEKADYPSHAKASVQYGSGVEALVSYLSVGQYLPYKRLTILLKDLFNLSLSEGTVFNLLERTKGRAKEIYEQIRLGLLGSASLGSDETGVRVKGEQNWLWTWQNADLTYLSVQKTRGFAGIEAIFPDGLANSVLVSDRLAAQLKTNTKAKQVCLAHLLRDLNALQESEKQTWASDFKSLLKKAIALGKTRTSQTQTSYDHGLATLESQLKALILNPIDPNYPQTKRFQKAMSKHQAHLLTFLKYEGVPPDNNASERSIRNVKVKQKVSGSFKTGAEAFAVIRSLIETFNKEGLNIYDCLKTLSLIPNTS